MPKRLFTLWLAQNKLSSLTCKDSVNMGDAIDFGELSNDEDLKSRILDFEESMKGVNKILEKFCSVDIYQELSPEDKVRYDLFQAFAINSLYWFYLRIKGVDTNQHDIRTELNRIKDFMVRSKKIYEKQNLMPRLDQAAAKRFIKSGLWAPKQSSSTDKAGSVDEANKPVENTKSRKRKREPDEDD